MNKPKITITGSIKCENLPDHLYDAVLEVFKLENPLYEKLRRMGNDKALFAVKKHFMYYIINNDKKVIDQLGRGAEKFLKHLFIQEGVDHNCAHLTSKVKLEEEFYSPTLKLRDYQEGVLDHVNENVGILKLGTGFGKTIIALKLVERLQQRTLIVVPRAHLRDQFVEEIEKYYGFTPQILKGDGPSERKHFGKTKKIDVVREVDDGTPIALATIQTLQSMNKKGSLVKWKNKFGCVIADECHGYVTDKSRAIFREFKAHHLYGMTATPDREDGQGPAIMFTFGAVLVDKELPMAKPRVVEEIPFGKIPVMEYPDMIEEMVNHDERNIDIAGLAEDEVSKGRKVLILTKRVAHTKKIGEYLGEIMKVYEIYSDDKNKSELLNKLKKNELDFDIIIGTASLLGTGLDIPSLDTLIIACDLKSSILTKQGVGRITRLFEGKEDPVVIDIHDKSNGILHRQFLARRKVYQENGWLIN